MESDASRDRGIIACDASGGASLRDGGADVRWRVNRAHAMHADPESPACREESQLLPDDQWLKVKAVPANGNLSPGVYYPTTTKRFVEPTTPVAVSPTESNPYCVAFVRFTLLLAPSLSTLVQYII